MESNVLQGVSLSPIQKRIYKLHEESPVFFQQCTVEIASILDVESLQAAVDRVISEHDILKTRYAKREALEFPMQEVDDTYKVLIKEKEGAPNQFEQSEFVKSGIEADSQGLSIEVITNGDASFFLVVTLPTLSSDSYSIYRLTCDICNQYLEIGANTDHDSTRIGYGQFSDWQNEMISSPDQYAEEFWNNYKFQNHNQTALPLAKKSIENDKFEPARQCFDLPVSVQSRLSAIDKKANAEYTLMGAYALLLKRLIGTDTVTIGYQGTKRTYKELDDTLGLVSKLIPIAVPVEDGIDFTGLITNLENQIEEVQEWEDYFTWDSIEDSNLDYFRWGFEFFELSEVRETQKQYQLKELVGVSDKFDLNLKVIKNEKTFAVEFNYNTQLLDAKSVKELISQYVQLLEEILKNGNNPVQRIFDACPAIVPFLNSVEFNEGNKTIVESFREIAARYPDGIALKKGSEAMSFAELDRDSDTLAAYLVKSKGVTSGDIVAISVTRSNEMIISILAALKSGAAYLPIDVKTPSDRIKLILENSGSKVLISDIKAISAVSDQSVFIQDGFVASLPTGDQVEMPAVSPSDVAYIIYTSGSTGVPKGVRISHDSLVNYVDWFIGKHNINSDDNTLIFSSIAFDLGYTSLWSSLLSGATMVLHEETEHLDPIDFANDMVEHGITYIKLTPSHFSLLTSGEAFENEAYQLRLIVLGGEEIQPADVEKFLDYYPKTFFLNHYGPTEATIGVLTNDITKDTIASFKHKPVIGKPIDNTAIFILNEHNQPAVIGQTGEICVSGRGVARGYLGDQVLTDEKFVENPFMTDCKMYRTGDLGRWLADGTVEFLGRRDFQVKIRGFRIEVGEIENVITSFPGVAKVSVQIFESGDVKDKQIAAFVVSDQNFEVKKLTEHLQEKLPHYMIPSRIMEVGDILLLPNGKVNAKLLLKELDKQSGTTYKAPTTPLEQQLASMWAEILAVEKVGITDNFFALGGHSLKAAQLVTAIFKGLDKKVTLKSIFENPTIQQLALVVDNVDDARYTNIEKIAEQAYYPASHAQTRLWISDQFEKNKVVYNSPSYFKIKGEIDVDVMRRAFQALFERHESLRTTFISVEGAPMQRIHSFEQCGFELKVEDLTGQEHAHDRAMEKAAADSAIPFDLEKGPLFSAKLFMVDDNQYLLACNIHHIISDGWSIRILYDELLIIYDDLFADQNISLQPLNIQYRDYSAWHQTVITEKEEGYWMDKLAHFPEPIALPYDHVSDLENTEYYREMINFSLDDSNKIKEIAKKLNTTVSNFILTIYALFINQLTGQDDIMIGFSHANRNHKDTENLIGFFINLLAIRVQFSPDDSLNDMVKTVSQSAVEAFDNSNYPFDLLVEKLHKNRKADRQPFLNVMYDFKNFSDVLKESEYYEPKSGLEIEMFKLGDYISSYDLIFHAMENGDIICYEFEYKKECFLPETARNFYKLFQRLANILITELSKTSAE